jgi:polyisoprenoid-binding protein YceI
MKKVSSILLVVGGLFAANIQRAPIADNATIATEQVVAEPTGKKLKVNSSASSLNWTGTKPSGKHNGTITVKSGKVHTDGTTITGGNFLIDMTSINCSDLSGKGKEGLEGHLKSPDFFDVAKNPTATFTITDVAVLDANQQSKTTLAGATHTISGNLLMRGVTKNVTFPAKVTASKKKVTAEADFNIDRTEWGIVYGADGKVAKEINLKLNLVAGK